MSLADLQNRIFTEGDWFDMRTHLPSFLALGQLALKVLEKYPPQHANGAQMYDLCKAYAERRPVDPRRFDAILKERGPAVGWLMQDDRAARMSAAFITDMCANTGFDAFDEAGILDQASAEVSPIFQDPPLARQWFEEYFEELEKAGWS